MAKTVDQIIAEFKLDDKSLDQNFLNAIRAEVADAHTQLQTATKYKTEGEQARNAAKEEKARIDAAIAAMGDSSLENTKLKAQLKAFRAMTESLKADGLDLDLPADLMTEPKGGDPEPKGGGIPKEWQDRMALLGQGVAAANVAAQYTGLTGEPFPEDMQEMVMKANRAGKTVQAYAEETYKLSEKMQTRRTAAEEARTKKQHAEWEADYKKKNPVTSESPFMRPGVDSPFSRMPKVNRDNARDTNSFAGLSDIQKLRKAQENARQMFATQVQEQ